MNDTSLDKNQTPFQGANTSQKEKPYFPTMEPCFATVRKAGCVHSDCAQAAAFPLTATLHTLGGTPSFACSFCFNHHFVTLRLGDINQTLAPLAGLSPSAYVFWVVSIARARKCDQS